jgi:hypothetical protein
MKARIVGGMAGIGVLAWALVGPPSVAQRTATWLDDSASLGRVDVEMLSDDSALATWIEVADGRSQFRARRVSPDGQRSPPVTIAGLAGGRAGGSPRVARHGDELVFAWTESSGDKAKLQTAVARLSNPMR